MELVEKMYELRDKNESLKDRKGELDVRKFEGEEHIARGSEWYKETIKKKEKKRDGFKDQLVFMENEMVDLDEEHKEALDEMRKQYKHKLDAFQDEYIELESKASTQKHQAKQRAEIEK